MVPVMPERPSCTERQHAAVEAAAFRQKYPRSRRLKADHSWSISATGPMCHFKLVLFAKDWLNANCPGWGLLHTSETGSSEYVSYIGFAEPQHMALFKAAESMMYYREYWHVRQDTWAYYARQEQAMEKAWFRAKYPVTHRMRGAAKYPIWDRRFAYPRLLDEVSEWLDENAPEWWQVPKSHFIGFADPDHAVCFKTVWA
jgi:hypothetical protein